MDEQRTPEQRALVRVAAQDILSRPPSPEPWHLNYRTMARGTVAALDWLEGRTDVAPSTEVRVRPDDLVSLRRGVDCSALDAEVFRADAWGSGEERPPREDMHFHGAVWSLLRWWRDADDPMFQELAIDVPDVSV